MTSKYDILIIIGTFLPLIGTGLTVVLASVFKGKLRWTALITLPALTMLLCWIWADIIWQDGNMLAAALFFIYLISLFIYYPVLTVSGLIILRQNRQGQNTNNRQED